MREITIVSGKGGTGKTVLTAAFAALANKACFVDCDVDAADLHLLLTPEVKQKHTFRSGKTARIDKKLCAGCGECIDVCRFGAINSDFEVDGISCEGCAICSIICPSKAVTMDDNLSGEWYVSDTKYGPFIHARLGIAEENSGKLVTTIRRAAQEIADTERLDYVINDGPPGIGCPVIASLSGVDLALIVTEPTLAGIHDMERIADLIAHFSIPVEVIINKYDINLKNTEAIGKICSRRKIRIAAQLPYSETFTEAVVRGVPLPTYRRGKITEQIADLWQTVARG
jgi:MinD superfamily P-loop ATPase